MQCIGHSPPSSVIFLSASFSVTHTHIRARIVSHLSLFPFSSILSAFCILHSVHPVSCRLVIPPIFYSLQYRISQIHWICITHPSLSLHVCIEYGDAWQFNNSIPFISHGCHYLCFCLSVSISKCLLWCFYFNLQLYP